MSSVASNRVDAERYAPPVAAGLTRISTLTLTWPGVWKASNASGVCCAGGGISSRTAGSEAERGALSPSLPAAEAPAELPPAQRLRVGRSCSRCLQVALLIVPVTLMPSAFWNRLTALSVVAPKTPSMSTHG